MASNDNSLDQNSPSEVQSPHTSNVETSGLDILAKLRQHALEVIAKKNNESKTSKENPDERLLGRIDQEIKEIIELPNNNGDGEVREQSDLSERIRTLEVRLGITSNLSRMKEASLFIDSAFIRVAALRGDAHPEYVFGTQAWASWLEARDAMRTTETITVDTIHELHKLCTKGLLPDEKRGTFRTSPISGKDYGDIHKPLSLTPEQAQAVESNPLLTLERLADDEYIIQYPFIDSEETYQKFRALLSLEGQQQLATVTIDELSQKLLPPDLVKKRTFEKMNSVFIEALIVQLCNDLNIDASSADNIFANAAAFEKKFISIHPYLDGNGRLGRLLMNWYLEKHKKKPYIVSNSDNDLYTSDDEWSDEVREGSDEYFLLDIDDRSRKKADTPRQVFFNESEQKFYDALFSKQYPLPDTTRLSLKEYSEYLEKLRDEYGRFKSTIEYSHSFGLTKEIMTSGGLIPDDFIEAWGMPTQQEKLMKYYHPDKMLLYRGGVIRRGEISSVDDLTRLFIEPTGITASNRALALSNTDAQSLRRVSLSDIRQTMRDYNNLLILDSQSNATEVDQTVIARESQLMDRIDRAHALRETEMSGIRDGKYLSRILHSHRIGSVMKPVVPDEQSSKDPAYSFWHKPKDSSPQFKINDNDSMWLSPATSTSFEPDSAFNFANTFWTEDNKHYGVFMTCLTPKSGVIASNEGVNIPLLSSSEGQ